MGTINWVLAAHYRVREEKFGSIIICDIRYRMGRGAENEDDE